MNDKHLHAWFVVFVVAVFLAGMGGGVILDRYVGPRRPPGGRLMQELGGGRAAGPATIRHGLVSDLQLSADQQAKLDAIFAARHKRIQEIQNQNRARFETEQQELRAEIEQILTPEQRKRFAEWLAREPMPGLRRMPGRGMGPGRPGRGMGGPGRGMGPGAGGRAPGI